MSTQWQNNLKGGYRVENIRPTGDPIRPWQGEVTLGDDDVQTWTWTSQGQYYGGMPSEYDLVQNDEYKVGVASALWRQCRCGKIAETEIQVGWDTKANAGAGGGQYEQVCWDCRQSDEARARDSHWRQVDMDEIGGLMFSIVQTRQPIEVRLRDFSDDPWSQEQLVGFRLDHNGEHRAVYFVDANGREWLYCQVSRA
jgi:hypothetical protein